MAQLDRDMTSPAYGGFAITPDDSDTFANPTRAIYVGTTGNIKLVTLDGDTLTFNSVPAGMILPVRATKVFSTDTTASNMVGLL